MAHRPVKGYQVRHSIGHACVIVLTYEGGGNEILTNLSVTEANFLVDILRHEKPIWFDAANRELSTGVEPVGEGE